MKRPPWQHVQPAKSETSITLGDWERCFGMRSRWDEFYVSSSNVVACYSILFISERAYSFRFSHWQQLPRNVRFVFANFAASNSVSFRWILLLLLYFKSEIVLINNLLFEMKCALNYFITRISIIFLNFYFILNIKIYMIANNLIFVLRIKRLVVRN